MTRQSLVFLVFLGSPVFLSFPAGDLLPGAYTVTAQHDGFQAVTVSPIFVVHETATVVAHTSSLQTDCSRENSTMFVFQVSKKAIAE